jgi:hypothetical protein
MEAKNPNAVAGGRIGGSVTTLAKASAARANGKLGGRPTGSSTLYRLAAVVAKQLGFVQLGLPMPHCGRGKRIGIIRIESWKEIITWSVRVRGAGARGLPWVRLSLRTTPGRGVEADYCFKEGLLKTGGGSGNTTPGRSGLDLAVAKKLKAAFKNARLEREIGG